MGRRSRERRELGRACWTRRSTSVSVRERPSHARSPLLPSATIAHPENSPIYFILLVGRKKQGVSTSVRLEANPPSLDRTLKCQSNSIQSAHHVYRVCCNSILHLALLCSDGCLLLLVLFFVYFLHTSPIDGCRLACPLLLCCSCSHALYCRLPPLRALLSWLCERCASSAALPGACLPRRESPSRTCALPVSPSPSEMDSSKTSPGRPSRSRFPCSPSASQRGGSARSRSS